MCYIKVHAVCAFGNTNHFIAILSYFSVTLYSHSERHTKTLTQNNSLRVYSWMSAVMNRRCSAQQAEVIKMLTFSDLHVLLSLVLCSLENPGSAIWFHLKKKKVWWWKRDKCQLASFLLRYFKALNNPFTMVILHYGSWING